MLKIILLLFFITISVFAHEIDDICEYRFIADGSYEASLIMKVTDVRENQYSLTVEFKSGSVQHKKNIIVKKNIKSEDFLKEILTITSTYNKEKINIISQKIDDDYTYIYKDRKYKGALITAEIEIEQKKYKLSYTLSNEIPILNILRFSITQNVEGKKKYPIENLMLIKTFGNKDKLRKL